MPPVVAPPAHPPTMPGAIAHPAREAMWPTPLGVIAILFGAGGVLMSVYGAATPWLMGFFEGFTARGPIDAASLMMKWAWWLAGLNALGVVVAGVLLFAGIGLLRRRAWSVGMIVA